MSRKGMTNARPDGRAFVFLEAAVSGVGGGLSAIAAAGGHQFQRQVSVI